MSLKWHRPKFDIIIKKCKEDKDVSGRYALKMRCSICGVYKIAENWNDEKSALPDYDGLHFHCLWKSSAEGPSAVPQDPSRTSTASWCFLKEKNWLFISLYGDSDIPKHLWEGTTTFHLESFNHCMNKWMNELMDEYVASKLMYIRCISPNEPNPHNFSI